MDQINNIYIYSDVLKTQRQKIKHFRLCNQTDNYRLTHTCMYTYILSNHGS